MEAIRTEPYRGAPPTTKDGQCYSIVRAYRVFFVSISLLSSRPPRNTYSFAAFVLASFLVRNERRSKAQRGDPLKAQGAQPCKGDQTLGKVEAISTEPYRGDPPNN